MGRAGTALKDVLEAYGISQNRLAIALQVKPSVVNRWFHGQVDPNGETIVAIVRTLGEINIKAAERFIQLYLGDLLRPAALVQLRPTQPVDLNFVLTAEYHPDSRPYVSQWSHEQHLAALTDPDIAHLMIETANETAAIPGSGEPAPEPAQPVGYAIIAGLCDPNQCIELRRLVIVPKERGYGKAALAQIKQFAFQTHSAHRLWLDVKVGNDRAQAVYRAAGFTAEGTLRDGIKTADGFESLIIMSLLRPDARL
jgi:diamine N-acetyltransferase